MNETLLQILLFFPVFLFALTIHEIAHALTANWGGDLTATYQNRLTLNPIVHMDLVGTVIFPLLMITQGWFLFGWAKPVPVDESRFKDKTWNVVVALAGPFSNLLLIIFGGLILLFFHRILLFGEIQGWWVLGGAFFQAWLSFIQMYIAMNAVLMLFNLIPIPPLDGSHVLYHFFIRGNSQWYPIWDFLRVGGFFLLWIVIFLTPVGDALGAAVNLITQFCWQFFQHLPS